MKWYVLIFTLTPRLEYDIQLTLASFIGKLGYLVPTDIP